MEIEISHLDRTQNLDSDNLPWLVQAIKEYSKYSYADYEKWQFEDAGEKISYKACFSYFANYAKALAKKNNAQTKYVRRYNFDSTILSDKSKRFAAFSLIDRGYTATKKAIGNPDTLASMCHNYGLLETKNQKFKLSDMAEFLLYDNMITIEEFSFVLLSKQWVMVDNQCKKSLLWLLKKLVLLQNKDVVQALLSPSLDANKVILQQAAIALVLDCSILDVKVEYKPKVKKSKPKEDGKGAALEAKYYVNGEEIIISGANFDIIFNFALQACLFTVFNNAIILTNESKDIFTDFIAAESQLTKYEVCVEKDRSDYFCAKAYGVFELLNENNECIYSVLYPNLVNLILHDKKSMKNNSVLNNKSRQLIYFGAPGTGKSHKVKESTHGKLVYRTTFHPDTDYSSFVGAYKPIPKGTDKITYEFVPQIFTEAYIKAWMNYSNDSILEKEVCLVIEELNRGNCAQIFGDLFQLLDRSKSGFSEYAIMAQVDLEKYLREKSGLDITAYYNAIRDNSDKTDSDAMNIPEWDSANPAKNKLRLCLPPNLSIVCTMNTSDQSLFPMDSAFKRRFEWEYVPIDYNNEKSDFKIEINGQCYSWLSFLNNINPIIKDKTRSADKQLGNFFVKPDLNDDTISQSLFVSKVMFYLWSEVCKDNIKAREVIYRYDKAGENTSFDFDDLFGPNSSYLIEGMLKNLKVGCVGQTNVSETDDEEQGTSLEEMTAHHDYMKEFYEYLNNGTTLSSPFKVHMPNKNGMIINTDKEEVWMCLARTRKFNVVSFISNNIDKMKQICEEMQAPPHSGFFIPKGDNNSRTDDHWYFSEKQAQAKKYLKRDNKKSPVDEYPDIINVMNDLYNEIIKNF